MKHHVSEAARNHQAGRVTRAHAISGAPDRPLTPVPFGVPKEADDESAEPKVVRVTAKLPGAAVEQLRANAAENGDTLNQGIKGAVATKLFLDEAIKEGGSVLVRKKDGTLVELVLP